jgi:Arc/MetJ-type ribon-helix-helix transcriptional regulator
MRTTKSVTISLPPEQLKTAERMAKQQSRTMSELFREGLRRLQQEEAQLPSASDLKYFAAAIRSFREDARRAGLDKMTKAEINAEVAAARKGTGQRTSKRPPKRSGK